MAIRSPFSPFLVRTLPYRRRASRRGGTHKRRAVNAPYFQSFSSTAVTVGGYLKDSVLSNIVNRNPAAPALRVDRENGLVNVVTAGIVNAAPAAGIRG